jgi:hypothetical protein
MGIDILTLGSNALNSVSPVLSAEKAFRADSVEERYTASGPAAATMPFLDAMLRREAVGAGGADHGGVNWTFASPAMARNPRVYYTSGH